MVSPRWFVLSAFIAASSLHAADPATGWWPPFVPDVPPPAVAAPGPVAGATETLVLDAYEAAGISGFRKDWDRPIPLRHDGLKKVSDRGNFGKGEIAVWDDPDQPGALACDAVHRSLLVRFPEAAERIAADPANRDLARQCLDRVGLAELAERQITDAVHTTRVDDPEARAGLGHDPLPLPQRQCLEGLVLQAVHRTAFIEVAHPALEGHVAAAGRIGEGLLQGGHVERAGAEGEARLSHRPPAG